VGPRPGLDNVEKRKFLTLLGLKLQPLSHPAHNQLLYQLRYPGSCIGGICKLTICRGNAQKGQCPICGEWKDKAYSGKVQ
jgi:hypothetical protein